MQVRANAVVLVLYQRSLSFLERVAPIHSRAGQHKTYWMKQPETSVGETSFRGQRQRLSNVAEKKVGAMRIRKRCAEAGRDGFFDQAFLQADPHVAGKNFQQVFCFEARAAAEDHRQQWMLLRRTTR